MNESTWRTNSRSAERMLSSHSITWPTSLSCLSTRLSSHASSQPPDDHSAAVAAAFPRPSPLLPPSPPPPPLPLPPSSPPSPLLLLLPPSGAGGRGSTPHADVSAPAAPAAPAEALAPAAAASPAREQLGLLVVVSGESPPSSPALPRLLAPARMYAGEEKEGRRSTDSSAAATRSKCSRHCTSCPAQTRQGDACDQAVSHMSGRTA